MKDALAWICWGLGIAVVITLLAGCDAPDAGQVVYHRNAKVRWNVPDCHFPESLRLSNYGGGSCAHVGMQNSLRWAGLGSIAEHWRANYGGGAGVSHIVPIARRYGLDVIYTTDGEYELLEFADRHRLPAMIFYFSRHAINFVRIDNHTGQVVVMDNNGRKPEHAIDARKFRDNWNAYGRSYGHRGGVAFVLLYPAAEPTPPCGTTPAP